MICALDVNLWFAKVIKLDVCNWRVFANQVTYRNLHYSIACSCPRSHWMGSQILTMPSSTMSCCVVTVMWVDVYTMWLQPTFLWYCWTPLLKGELLNCFYTSRRCYISLLNRYKRIINPPIQSELHTVNYTLSTEKCENQLHAASSVIKNSCAVFFRALAYLWLCWQKNLLCFNTITYLSYILWSEYGNW